MDCGAYGNGGAEVSKFKNDLTEFVWIEEVDTFTMDYEIVNEYLSVGWRLFATRTEAHDEPEGQTQSTVYCLGWPEDLGMPLIGSKEIDAEIERRFVKGEIIKTMKRG